MHALVSGASMAGLSCAYWLRRKGFDVTVVERATDYRLGGAPIDVRGEALHTARRMGILDRIRHLAMNVAPPMNIIGADGTVQTHIDLTWFANESPDDVELTRGSLLTALRESIAADVDFHFGRSVESIDEQPDFVDVTFVDGSTGHYDLVVGADGLHSTVRGLAFGPEHLYTRHLGVYVALINLDTERDWETGMFNVPGLMVSVRQDCGFPLAYVMFASDPLDVDYRDVAQQRQIVAGRLSEHRGWQVPDVRKTFLSTDSPGFYFDAVSQIHLDRWSTDRVVLVGDAAHCAALLSGMGASLAMTGAEHLANALDNTPGRDLAVALQTYERAQRPLVDKAQSSVDGNTPVMVPRTVEELEQRNAELRRLALEHS